MWHHRSSIIIGRKAEVAKSKVSEKLLDAQHEVLHLKSSLEVCPCLLHCFKRCIVSRACMSDVHCILSPAGLSRPPWF